MLANYLKLAIKVLNRRKFFTFVSLFGISFTLMALMLISAILDHIFAPRAPENRLDRTLGVYSVRMTGPYAETSGLPGYGFLTRYVQPQTIPSAEAIAYFEYQRKVSSVLDGQPTSVYLKRTDGAFWQILDFDFLEGGPITEEDARAGQAVAVINETTRRRFFGGDEAVGRPLAVNGQSFRVVGVVRDVPFTRIVPFADVWVPISTNPSSAYRQEIFGNYAALLLAKDRSDLTKIQDELEYHLASAESPDPREYDRVEAYADSFFDFAARFVFGFPPGPSPATRLRILLSVLAVLFMVLPALNMVNINLSRILERASEIGVRKSFGASSWTLVGQFLVENILLTLLGGLVGFLLSGIALSVLNQMDLVPYADFGLNGRIFLYGLAMAAVFGFLSGVLPAWKMSRMHPVEALSEKSP